MRLVYTRGRASANYFRCVLMLAGRLAAPRWRRMATEAQPRNRRARQTQTQPQTQQDEYARYRAAGAGDRVVHDDAGSGGDDARRDGMGDAATSPSRPANVAVIDMMTGQPLKYVLAQKSALRVTLARPIVGEGGQARVRVSRDVQTIRAPTGARVRRRWRGDVQRRSLIAPRGAIVLPAGYRLTRCNLPSQVLTLPDGRTQVSFMHQGPAPSTLQIGMRPGAQTGDAAKPQPLTNARSWEPPPAQGPTERARLSERAAQDRDIVYFLQPPDTHAFSLYHDYTESREGSDKYLNVVRTGSTVSAPSGVVLDTGEAMKVEVLKGAQLAAAGIDAGGAGGDQVAADQEVVVFRYPAVKAGQSLRLRLSETYTAPASYRLDGEDLVFERSLGRPRNSDRPAERLVSDGAVDSRGDSRDAERRDAHRLRQPAARCDRRAAQRTESREVASRAAGQDGTPRRVTHAARRLLDSSRRRPSAARTRRLRRWRVRGRRRANRRSSGRRAAPCRARRSPAR